MSDERLVHMSRKALKAELLALLDDPEVQARVRTAILDGQSLIDVRTHDAPDRPPTLLTTITVPAGVSPTAIAAAIDAAVNPPDGPTRAMRMDPDLQGRALDPAPPIPKRPVPPWIQRRQPKG